MSSRNYTLLDDVLINADQTLRTLFGQARQSERPNPTAHAREPKLSEAQRQESARLMRVNHSGEVCAQALYQAQALMARSATVHEDMRNAAAEENDHLAWCAHRIDELGGRTSLLNPIYYAGALALGTLAGLAGDRWNLGFLAETERQVVQHLERHLARLPVEDHKSRAILDQIKLDEAEHAVTAIGAGGSDLPLPIPQLMRASSKLMTGTSYWI